MKKKYFLINILVVLFFCCISCNKSVTPSILSQGKSSDYDSTSFNYIYAEAIRCKLMGGISDALELFSECLKINPNSDAVYYNMSQLLLSNGDMQKGKSYLQKAITIDQNNVWYYMMLGSIYYQNNQSDSAIYVYEKVVDLFPDDSYKTTLADLYVNQGDYKKANSIYSELEENYGIGTSTTISYINSLVNSNNLTEALTKARSLVDLYPNEISYRSVLAEIYKINGDTEKAMEVYTSLIDSYPDSPEVQLSLCDFLLSQNKFEDLSSLLNKVIINKSITANDKILLLSSVLDNNKYINEEGSSLLLSLIVLEKIEEGNNVVVLLRPDLLSKMNRYQDASEVLSEIVDNNSSNYYAWESLLLCYLNLKDYVNLEKRAETCSRLFNRSFLAKVLYSTAAIENEHYSVALTELDKAEILAGNNEEMQLQVLSLRADAYYRMKDYNQAFETFEAAIENNNQDILILNNYAYYLAERNLNLKQAEKMAKQVIEAEPENPTYLDTYAWVLYKSGKLSKSIKIFESIISNNNDAVYYEHVGFVYQAKRLCDKAISSWQQAISIDPSLDYLNQQIQQCKE